MKKLFSVFLAIMMLFSMSLAAAEEAALKPLEVSTEEAVELPDLSGITAPDYDAYMEEDKGDISIKGLVTHDTVAISGSQYQVLTPTGILFTYTAPSGVVALTQDYVQQATLFSSYYSNPLEVVSKWIDNGMHLNVYYSTNDVDVFIYVFDTPMAQIFQNSNNMTQQEADYLFSYMQTDDEYIKGATSGTYGWLGGNVWFLGDMRATKGVVRLFSFVGGKEIYAYAKITSDTQYDNVIDMLDTLIISAR